MRKKKDLSSNKKIQDFRSSSAIFYYYFIFPGQDIKYSTIGKVIPIKTKKC